MFKNYLILGFRNFRRNKIFSLINIAGLATGISASLVIYLIVQHEFSYDKFHKDGDSIYRVVSKIEFADLTIHNSGVPVPTARAASDEITGLEAVTHFIVSNGSKVSVSSVGSQSPSVFRNQNSWLQDFVYRTSLSWWVFAVTGAGMLLIAMLILSIRTIKSAIENPVKSLRTE